MADALFYVKVLPSLKTFSWKSRCQVATVVTIKNLITMPEYSIAEYADIYFV
jgi:hypothetical protein